MINEIQIGPLTIHIYGLMIGIGFISAYLVTDYRGKKKGFILVRSGRRNSRREISILYC